MLIESLQVEYTYGRGRSQGPYIATVQCSKDRGDHKECRRRIDAKHLAFPLTVVGTHEPYIRMGRPTVMFSNVMRDSSGRGMKRKGLVLALGPASLAPPTPFVGNRQVLPASR